MSYNGERFSGCQLDKLDVASFRGMDVVLC
jgi:hypothetical protein